jgi:hypothetical protein
MPYRITGIDVHNKKKLAVVVTSKSKRNTYSSDAGTGATPSSCKCWRNG